MTIEDIKLTEAPDDNDIMSDDDLDAQEQRERDELEARFKARRDDIAKKRAEKEAKAKKDAELKAKAEEKLKEINNDWQFEHLFDVLVPASGKCDTLAGELVRAANKLEYRWFNDGDRFFEDYGIETCGSPAIFLMYFGEEGEDDELEENPFWDMFVDAAESNLDEDKYDNFINEVKDKIVDIIKAHPKLLSTENTEDAILKWSRSDAEEFFSERDMIPTYDYDSSIPPELQAHLDKGNIDERDLIWEVQRWIENMGNSTDDVRIDWGNVYIYGLNKADFDEIQGNLYDWLEEYAQELTNEYGDPDEDDEEEESKEENEEE